MTNQDKNAIWLNEFETKVLADFIAKLFSEKKLDNTWVIATLENVYKQIEK